MNKSTLGKQKQKQVTEFRYRLKFFSQLKR